MSETNNVGSDEWYAYNAVTTFERLGWKWEGEPIVKLIHPQGRENFAHCGVVFIDSETSQYTDHFVRLCALFPGQRMPLHHHLKRAEVFKVVAGTVRAHWDTGEMLDVPQGGLIQPSIGVKHGVSTDQRGGLYLGVCDRSHLTDVYWDETDGTLVEPEKRVTIHPLTTSLQIPLSGWNEFRIAEPLQKSVEDAWQHSLDVNTAELTVQ
jgi:quercetin dioxygenase-like cupin family protein